MYSKFCKMQEHVFKIYVHDSTIITDHQNMWKYKLRNIFCWENLQCCCYSNNILHFQSLLPHIFCLKRTFFFSFFILVDMLINFVIFMITIFVDQLFCQPLFSCHYIWNVEFEKKLEHSCITCHALLSFKNYKLYVSFFNFFSQWNWFINFFFKIPHCLQFSCFNHYSFLCGKSICLFKSQLN